MLLLPRESVVVMFSTIGEITVAEISVLLLPSESVVVMFSKIVGMVMRRRRGGRDYGERRGDEGAVVGGGDGGARRAR